jgi:SAM-dependent methyltransferase
MTINSIIEPSPLVGINSLSDLMQISYFEFLACMGEFSIHPGGSFTTQELLNSAQVCVGEIILEIGSGTGWTTQRLLEGGANVTVVEKCPRMLASTLRNCRNAISREPNFILGTAEDLSQLPQGEFNFAIYECILGFVQDKYRAISECKRVLNPHRSKIGVVDVHYVSTPPPSLLEELEAVFSIPIEPLYESDWKNLFKDFDLVHWKTYDLPNLTPPTASQIQQLITQAELISEMPWIDETALLSISQRWANWEKIFAHNRKYLECHVAIWATPLL